MHTSVYCVCLYASDTKRGEQEGYSDVQRYLYLSQGVVKPEAVNIPDLTIWATMMENKEMSINLRTRRALQMGRALSICLGYTKYLAWSDSND